MIFTFDLDRTLIFSQKQLTATPEVFPAEYREGVPCGFMTAGALSALREIQGQSVCLANTLRGLEQSLRVCFVGDHSCRYLALQNGLYLYRDGVLDADWALHVSQTVAALSLKLDGGIARVLATLSGIERLSKRYEYLAVFFVDEDLFDDAAYFVLAEELAALGWLLHCQRKKLYLSPLAIDKGKVLHHVQALEGGMEAVGCGDSYFDIPMLRACRDAYSLHGCELYEGDCGLTLHFSHAPAQAGTEEILNLVLSTLPAQGIKQNELEKKLEC